MNADELLKLADLHLYEVKRRRKAYAAETAAAESAEFASGHR